MIVRRQRRCGQLSAGTHGDRQRTEATGEDQDRRRGSSSTTSSSSSSGREWRLVLARCDGGVRLCRQFPWRRGFSGISRRGDESGTRDPNAITQFTSVPVDYNLGAEAFR